MIIGAETFTEQLSRVQQMAQDRDGETWDLSDNDRAALEAVIVSHAGLRGLLKEWLAINQEGCSGQDFHDMCVNLERVTRTAISKAEGTP